jgi:hypothetical protein
MSLDQPAQQTIHGKQPTLERRGPLSNLDGYIPRHIPNVHSTVAPARDKQAPIINDL